MTAFIRLLGGALAAFLILGGAQSWRSLFPRPEPPVDEVARRAAATTVLDFAQLSRHFYATGGDPRFAERLPASKELIDELQRDASYVRHNGRVEEPDLIRMEVTHVELPASDRAEVRTKEYWTTKYRLAANGSVDGVRSDIVTARYRLVRDGGKWLVAAWDPEASQ